MAPFVFVWLLREFIAFSYYIQFGLLPQQWRWELVRRSPESAANCVATPLPFCHLDNNKAILNACFSCSSLFFLSFFGLEQMCRCKCISVSLYLCICICCPTSLVFPRWPSAKIHEVVVAKKSPSAEITTYPNSTLARHHMVIVKALRLNKKGIPNEIHANEISLLTVFFISPCTLMPWYWGQSVAVL